MSEMGGHTYTCGHVKYCGDHVQMIEETCVCWDCKSKKNPSETEQLRAELATVREQRQSLNEDKAQLLSERATLKQELADLTASSQVLREQKEHAERERDALQKAFSDFACTVMARSIAGFADAAIVKHQPMNENHALAALDKLVEHTKASEADNAKLREAMVECAAILEALRASVKWELADELKQAIIAATDKVRALLPTGENNG